MKISVFETKEAASKYASDIFYEQIKKQPNSVLGLATGGTMSTFYEKLSGSINENPIDVKKLNTFNLDEYYEITSENPQSYHAYMKTLFFDKVGIDSAQTHFPYQKEHQEDPSLYDQQIDALGGIDIQLLGIGRNGHIGFNEPNTPFNSITRVVDLSETTIQDNARFFEDINEVPKQAVSMGISTIMKAKRIILLAFGEAKKDIIIELSKMTTPDENIPASILLTHPNVEIIVDKTIGEYLN
ncbi:glucosamine-6-phosphate deaminase [Macrococcus sp. DPC7161]|uniref:glucosamine-6-phosphate deaminase n=1 Tax=Macrococcus sp. DPC7161 TaxID=2507060 RepID=UPI00100B6DA3|nr:glucosamine-6-phosphate deaminase [Macrococcus sp. DPC7161]RXK17901.1 glucosamine-6-phosphate deaminase [Macrococcus sp. DPC7161]